jgi:tetraacyldisaccharide 4'-kinase
MNFIRFILIPLAPVYGFIILIRNLLFDKNIFKAVRVKSKIISVGNLTVGGSGKTPLVIYLIELLKSTNRKVGVLSRGYGRSSIGYLLVSDGMKMLSTVDQSGDEIYHTATETGVPAAVCERRVQGAKRLSKDTGVDTIVLDDAFQHRWIKRDIDLLIIEQSFLNSDDRFLQSYLPAGIMREGFESINRADAVVLNRKFSEKEKVLTKRKIYFKDKKVFTSYYRAIGFTDVIKKIDYSIEDFIGQKGLIVSGIASPESFLKVLNQAGVEINNQIIFRDHKEYTLKEVQQIRKRFYSTNSHSVITTEKDAVKLAKYSREFDDIDIFYLKINLCMDDEESFRQYIINKLND